MNNYLHLDTDDMRITSIINLYIKQFNADMLNQDFKDLILEIDHIDNGGLSEYDEDLINDLYNKLYGKCPSQIEYFESDVTQMARQQTFGEFMKFLKSIYGS